ncbi:hypothetical protein MY4824_006760 [Beauveria thailandica]
MNVFSTVLALCNCLLLGASLAQARVSIPTKAAFDIPNLSDSMVVDARSDNGRSIQNGAQKHNCQLLLRRESVDCTGLSSKACDLVSWIHKQAECATKTGNDAKRCCDDEERLPFGYQLKRFDRPQFPDGSCNADYGCRFGMSKWLCDMRDWEQAGFFSNFYQHRFNLKCPQQAEGRLSVTNSSNGDVNFRYTGIEADEWNEIRVFKVYEAPVHTGEKPSSVGWIMIKNAKGMVKLSSFSKNKLKPGKRYTAVVLRRADYDWLAPPVNFTMPWDELPTAEYSSENIPSEEVSNETDRH